MLIYLPIAEVSVNAFLLLGLGGLVGVLSGMFGVGGGFLMTPLLFFIGIPPAVAVATEANQIVASSFSGVLAHLKRRTVDLRMGTVLLIGGLVGAARQQSANPASLPDLVGFTKAFQNKATDADQHEKHPDRTDCAIGAKSPCTTEGLIRYIQVRRFSARGAVNALVLNFSA